MIKFNSNAEMVGFLMCYHSFFAGIDTCKKGGLPITAILEKTRLYCAAQKAASINFSATFSCIGCDETFNTLIELTPISGKRAAMR